MSLFFSALITLNDHWTNSCTLRSICIYIWKGKDQVLVCSSNNLMRNSIFYQFLWKWNQYNGITPYYFGRQKNEYGAIPVQYLNLERLLKGCWNVCRMEQNEFYVVMGGGEDNTLQILLASLDIVTLLLIFLFFFYLSEWREDQGCSEPVWPSNDAEPHGPAGIFSQVPCPNSLGLCHKVSFVISVERLAIQGEGGSNIFLPVHGN